LACALSTLPSFAPPTSVWPVVNDMHKEYGLKAIL